MNIAESIEEADIEICASGFDNLVMDGELNELRQHSSNLRLVGATGCAAIINELLDWISSEPRTAPLDLLESDTARTDAIWDRYNCASDNENPRELAKAYKQS